MPLYKSAQTLVERQHNNAEDFSGDEVILYETEPSKDEVLELHAPEAIEVIFKLPDLPGSDAPLEVSSDGEIEVEEKKSDKNDAPELEVVDPWDLKAVKPEGAIEWAKGRLTNIPKHDGKQILGLERAMAYLKRVDSDMSKMIASDYDGKIDIGSFEQIRREIYDALSRLERAKTELMKRYKQSADERSGLVKEAKQAHVGGMIISVPLLISTVARTCINSFISAGHSIEKVYEQQVKEYDLSKREQAELVQLLSDMGFFIRRDRLFPPGSKEKWNVSDGKGDYASQYYS